MKKFIYLLAFTLLGILLSFLLHSVIEIPVIYLLVSDFEKWGLGLSWDNWIFIHDSLGFLLLIIGIVVGFKQGKYWWKIIYKA